MTSQIGTILAKAWDAEEAAQMGEPSPWDAVRFSGEPLDHEWASARLSCAAAVLAALDDAGFAIVPIEPTEEMLRAGLRANRFTNKHNGEPGCPGVGSPPFPVDAFDANMTTCIDPEKFEAWEKAPKCLVARVTLPPERPWYAMLEARPK
jgi:hypothetical protein